MTAALPLALLGRIWLGDGRCFRDGFLIVDQHGRVDAVGPAAFLPDAVRSGDGASPPPRLRVLSGGWIGPALVDRHVHLTFGGYEAMLAGGVATVRDLGAPLADALDWRRTCLEPGGAVPGPAVQIAGPVLTAPGGYPSRGWGAGDVSRPVVDAAEAVAAVRELIAADVDMVKLALEAGGGQPVPSLSTAVAVVRAAHDAGIPVIAHALTARMVARAIDAGVDELAHVPVEVLPSRLVERIARAGVRVVSTIETFTHYPASAVVANAAALVAAGVPLVYGTDLGNAGTRPGADPRELERLADAGLGRDGALRAATRTATAGTPAALVVLDRDPLLDPSAWAAPLAVVAGTRIVDPAAAAREGRGSLN